MSTTSGPFSELGRMALRTHRKQYEAALKGLEPAEALPTILRWRLVAQLHHQGWSDVEVAAHTMTTLYTVCRIREEMGLPVNQPRVEGRSSC